MLQFVDERRIKLDAPVERYVSKVVRGDNDGRQITIRQLLQRSAGHPEASAPNGDPQRPAPALGST
ncbi:serine hydrolase [Spirillospora sp. NPDC048911]|uniref:serine hydrolase n=1 Tax=Spirillospora sp. NPDC048911 TaxID=3364527 RepID=UPI00371FAA63